MTTRSPDSRTAAKLLAQAEEKAKVGVATGDALGWLNEQVAGKKKAKQEAEAYVFFEPHNVVGSPGVVEEAAMDTRGEIGLRT